MPHSLRIAGLRELKLSDRIVIVTSVVVAATAAAVSDKFNAFGTVGGIIGSSVSATFLIVLGIMNMYILYKLVLQMKKVLALREGEAEEGWKVEGGGCLFRVLKKMFKLIDRSVFAFTSSESSQDNTEQRG